MFDRYNARFAPKAKLHADIIAAFIASHGVTRCPPRKSPRRRPRAANRTASSGPGAFYLGPINRGRPSLVDALRLRPRDGAQ
jgi:hypothetical protein